MRNRIEIQQELQLKMSKLNPIRHKTPLNEESTKVMLLMEMVQNKMDIIEALQSKIKSQEGHEKVLIEVINRKELKNK